MFDIILCYVPVVGDMMLLMKNSGGERMHCPYRECILSPTDFDVGSECWDSVCTHIGWRRCPKSSQMRPAGTVVKITFEISM